MIKQNKKWEISILTSTCVGAAGLLDSRVVAADGITISAALLETSTARLSTGVSSSALSLLGLVSISLAARETKVLDGHLGELVG
jgi:hypothetical protein